MPNFEKKTYLQVKAMVEGRDRRPELGYKLAMELSDENSALYQRINNKNSHVQLQNQILPKNQCHCQKITFLKC